MYVNEMSKIALNSDGTSKEIKKIKEKQASFGSKRNSFDLEIDKILHHQLPDSSRLKPPNYNKEITVQTEKEFYGGDSVIGQNTKNDVDD